ncbi:MAG: hypothetical protein EOO77_24130 [Oxalobacteraceae bacterium]|nr:MAG: hypothetical protein EOO77_24130 [Oxalobacteraceae bacterium]
MIFTKWRRHLLAWLHDDADKSGVTKLAAMYDELAALPAPSRRYPAGPTAKIAVPLILREPVSERAMSFLSTTAVFRGATDVTLTELTLECLYPADEETRHALLG